MSKTLQDKIRWLLGISVTALILISLTGGVVVHGLMGEVGNEAVVGTHTTIALNRDMDDAQIAFRSQVQEWKDLLLRGRDPQLRQKHYRAFHDRHDEVQASLKRLAGQMAQRGFSMDQLSQIQQAHLALLARYEAALTQFPLANKPDNYLKVDELVRGIDRKLAADLESLDYATKQQVLEQVGSINDKVQGRHLWQLSFVLAIMLALFPLVSLASFGAIGRMTRRIQEEKERLHVTLHSIGDAVVVTDPAGAVEYLNPVAEVMTGWALGEARGKPLPEIFNIVNEDTREVVANPVEIVLREGHVVGLANHTVLIARNGGECAIEDSAAPVRDMGGKICGVVLVFHDATEQRQAKRLLHESEERLRMTLRCAPDAVFICEQDGRIVYVNDNVLDTLGYSREELTRMTIFDLVPADWHEPYRQEAKLILADNEHHVFEIRLVKKDGSKIPMELNAVLLPDGRVYGSCRDITERKQAEAQLKISEEHYRQIIQTSMDGFFNTDTLGRILDVNDAYCQLTGYAREELLGMRITDVEAKESQEETAQHIQAIMAQGHARFETRHRRKDGQLLNIEVSVVHLPDNEDRCFFAFLRDITERKQADALEQQRFDELQAVYLISNATCGAESLDQVYEEAMESILRTLKADRVSILLFDADGLMHFKAWRNLSDTYRKAADGHSPWTQDAVDPQPILVDDIGLDAGWAHFLPVARAEGICAFGFIPLALRGRLIGKFMVYFNQPHHFTENEVRLAKIIAFHIAFTIGRKQAEEELRLRAQLLDSVSDTIFLLDLDGNFVYLNEAAWKTRGYTRDEMMGISLRVLNTPKYEKLIAYRFKEIMEKGQCIFESEHRRKDGSAMPVEINARTIELDGRKLLLSIIRDITERKQADQELGIAATAFETSHEGMAVTDANRAILKVNQSFTRITGYSAGEVVGKNPSILKSGKQDRQFYQAMWESLNRDKFWKGEIWNRRKNGEIYPEWLSIAAVTDQDDHVTHYVASFADILKYKEAEAQIHELAFYDPLTRLPNRRLLQDRLRQALAASVRNDRQGALLFIDLDNFKRINDTQGHTVGDWLLSEAANRLQTCIREGDTAARLGGDEFVVLLEDLDADELTAATQAETVGEKIRGAIGHPYLIDGHNYYSTASIGITLFRGPVKTMEEMFKRADAAMYQAKTGGRNTLRFFDPALQALVVTRVALESDLRHAISEQEQFQLYYQAQVDSSGHLTGAEALVRWLHPERGMVSPSEFIPLAEESGLILPLGHWVLATACRQLEAWAAQPETAHFTLAVNVSAKQLHLAAFVEEVLALVDYFGVNPGNLKLEITEGMLLDNVEDVIAKMTALQARGINFSMDDFGTGYSSLSYLKRLPLHQLKIDQSFVRNVITDPNDAAIARTIIALAQSMDLAVIAEGVETEAQRAFLELNGCHDFQGYLFSKPVPVNEFEKLITQW